MIKTRFAPSPTGFLHVGNLRAALFEYLYAKKNGGTFFIRIEDTDQERFVEGGIENILRSLAWVGIFPDEGVGMSLEGKVIQTGNSGPYIQSERLPIYKKYIEELLQKKHAYYCFCSKERLDDVRKIQEASKLPTGYDGHCRNLSDAEVQQKLQTEPTRVIRMKMPKEGITILHDMIRGNVEFKNALIDDQVLLKSDGFPTYHFAVVVDDRLMGATHVIRGEDWLPSAPKHIVLYDMFGWEKPAFAHLPLLVNEEKQKLSKRKGDVSVEDFRQKGYLPEALINFIAFLGWNPGDERELFTLRELEQEFDIERVSKAAAVFNREKLLWYNQQYIRKLDNKELLKRAMPFLENSGLVKGSEIEDTTRAAWLEEAIGLMKDRIATLADAPMLIGFLLTKELVYESDILVWKKSTRDQAKQVLEALVVYLNTIDTQDWNKALLEQKIGDWIKEKQYGVGDVLWPLRVSLSGQKNSPPPFDIAEILGKETSLTRISHAIQKLS